MKQKLLILLLTAMLAPWAAQAQTTVEIGDGTSTQNYPLPGYFGWNYDVFLYSPNLADELGDDCTISSIAFNVSSNNTSTGAQMYIWVKDVDAEYALANGTTFAQYITDATQVYANEALSTTDGWNTFNFSSTFSHEGGKALLVAVRGVGCSTTGDCTRKCYYTLSESNSYWSMHSDGSDPGQEASGSLSRNRANIQLEIIPAGGQICEKPEELTANGEPTDTEFSFEITGGSGLYDIFTKAGSDDWTNWEYEWEETTVNLTNLESNTAYQVRVRSVCDGDATSGWKSLSFTTKNPCAAPTNLQITDITTESATLTWTAGYQETEWTVKYKKSTDSEYTTETVSGTPCLALSGLSSNTIYNVQVYNCDNYVSANFTTAAGIPLNEVFATTSAPTGWMRYNTLLTDDVLNGTTALTSSSGGWTFGTINDVFNSHTKVNLYGSSCKYWLVTPTLLMEDNVQLTFDLALTAYSGSNAPAPATTGTDDKFVVLIQTESGWEILRQWDNAGSQYVLNNIACSAVGEAVAIDLSSYSGQNIAIAFYGESTASNADNNLHIDNVSIDYIPDCAKPTGLDKSDVTAHEATITWVSDADAWQVQLSDEEPIDVDEATYTFDGLDPETTYSVKVRANCGDTYSEWTTAVNFTTTIACPAPTALTVTPDVLSATFTWESFADEWEVAYATDATADPEEFIVGTVTDEATYTVNNLELGDYYFWVRSNCGDLDGRSQWAGPVSVHIGYCVPNPSNRDGKGITKVIFGMGDYMVNNVDEENGLPASSPYYGDYSSMVGAMQAGVESTISITYATGSGTVYSYGTIIWVDWDNSMSFEDSEIVYTGTSAQGSNGVPQVLEASFIVPADQATGEYRMRIAGADSYFDSYIGGTATANHSACFSSSYAVCHDYTLRVLEAPSCLTPTDLTIDYTGGTEATISWTSDAEAWNMRVNGEDVEGTITNPYTLTGLELATTYSVEVQAVCGEDGTSEWSNPVSFNTDLCMPEYMCEISYSFTDQYNDSWNGAYINILDATTGKLLHELTMPNVEGPYEGSFNVCDGREIQFVWVSGSYPNECGYTFTHNGDVILEKETNTTAPEAGVIFTYTVDCDCFMLDDDKDHSTFIEENDGQQINVKLGRTLLADGWNTFTVPFKLDPIPSGWTAWALDESGYDDGTQTLTLTFDEETSIIEAGKPYLVMVEDDVVDPTFNGVTIVDGTTTTETDYANFVPVMNPTTLTAGDNTVLYLGSANKLYYPSESSGGVTVKGFRAYFQLNGLTAGDVAEARSIVLNFGNGETTNIRLMENGQWTMDNSVYDLQGRRIERSTLNVQRSTLKKGVYIVNGRKAVIK